ncbi:MAG: DUF1826 domain-containing protein, partial [Pseudomonadota bacterium]
LATHSASKDPSERIKWPVATLMDIADLPAGLSRTSDAAICIRPVPTTVTEWLEMLDLRDLPEGRFILQAGKVAECVEDLFVQAGNAPSSELSWLCEDLSRQAECLSAPAGETILRLRVERITNNACSKFHVDNVVSRLICTYRGPGTQVAFAGSEANVLTVPMGMPILLKGKRWSSASPVQLHHRSPPIEGTGIIRLMTVLEAVTEQDLIPNYDRAYHNLNSL